MPGGVPAVSGLSFFEDESRSLGIADVLKPANQARFAYPDAPLRGRESDRVLWFRLQVHLSDQASTGREWLLVVPTVSTHELSFYGPYDSQGRALAEPVVTGMSHPWSTRPASSEQMAWRLRLPDTQTYTLYFRVDSTFARIYDVRIWRTVRYLEDTQDERIFDGLSYGMLLGLVVYALVLLTIFREGIYGWYLASVVCALLALAGFNGHSLRYLFPHWPQAAWFCYMAMPPAWVFCKLQFGRRLLRLHHFAPWLEHIVRLMLGALVLATVLAFANIQVVWMFRLVQACVLLSTMVLLVGALSAVRRRYWPAVLYSLGVALLLAGISAIIVASWGWVAWTPDQMNITQAALVAELVVFAGATASRLRLVLQSERRLSARTEQLVEALGTDALTGAASRSGFHGRAEALLAEGRPFSLMLLDLDGFKAVNDSHGHAAGDAILQAVVRRMQALLRGEDMVARLGGDEFALLLPGGATRAQLAALTERLAESCAAPVDFEGRALSVGMSVGIASYPLNASGLDELLRLADQAMYRSKRQRRATRAGHAFAGERD
ncbi:diguanylate cyclase [Xylophilus rhododendri]|uniref:Diguanylate cyclase n=2 Tax=Xylophilus rhododendri TaxID=2697032 RepID=A0A857JG85_9BURK|nr:diguanylate cyclase [Xylophilus rhododendri]